MKVEIVFEVRWLYHEGLFRSDLICTHWHFLISLSQSLTFGSVWIKGTGLSNAGHHYNWPSNKSKLTNHLKLKMSTDFCVEAILQRSCSSSSLSSQRSPISQRSPHQQDKLTPSTNVPSQPVKRGLKRKHDDEENNGRPTKRGRTVFSQGQLHYLESVFAHTPYPDKLLKETIAEKLGLEQQRVHVSTALYCSLALSNTL